MENQEQHFAQAQMVIRKPAAEVFEAFINPDITTKFWFNKSSGRLEAGKQVQWTWEMYHVSIPVHVKTIEPNSKIVIEWGEGPDQSTVEWNFKAINDNSTFVTIINSGLQGDMNGVIGEIRGATEGFTIVLAGLKAYLEHGIELNLVADKLPINLGN